MCTRVLLVTISLPILLICTGLAREDSTSLARNFEPGPNPPGATPIVFAPDVISTSANEHGCTFSPDGREFYFTRVINDTPTIMCARQVSGSWTAPSVASFSGDNLDRLPQMSPDGSTIYFQSRRPLKKDQPPGEVLIWFTTRTDAGDWDEPKLLAADLGAKQAGLSVTVANSGAIYTSGIVRLRPVDGKYAVAEKLPAYLDGSYPFIAPDESYIVYCSGKNRDLVVSFHQPDRSWTEPKLLLGQQKPFWVQGFPSVSPDGRYLFFTADHDIYWVSAGILEDLRPDGLR